MALLQGGRAEFEDGGVVERSSGDCPAARLRHRVARTSVEPPCIWVAVFGAPAPSGRV